MSEHGEHINMSYIPSKTPQGSSGRSTGYQDDNASSRDTGHRSTPNTGPNYTPDTGHHSTPNTGPTYTPDTGHHSVAIEHGDPEGSKQSTYTDLDDLKEQFLTMAEKKAIRRQIIADQGKIAGRSKWSKEWSVKWRYYKEDLKDALNNVKLWKSSLHEIEGRFGTGIRSYFAFLRWLFILNIYIFVLTFSFVVVPAIVLQYHSDSQTITAYADERNVTAGCAYEPYPSNSLNSFSQYIIWWFTGQGFLAQTHLFIGYYDNIATVDSRVAFYFNYNIPLAYLLVAFFCFLISLVLVVRKAGYGLSESLSSDSRVFVFCSRIFCGWDYCINDAKASSLKHSNLKLELKADLEDDKIRKKQANRTRKERNLLYLKRIFINILVIAILGGCLAGIFFAAQYALQNGTTFNNDFFLDLLITYLTSIVITAVNFVAPVLFGILVNFEDYSPDFAIRITLIRTVILRLTSVIFLYVVVYLQIYCYRYPNVVDIPFRAVCNYCEGLGCWETYLGQEMYKLTVFDFFITIAVTLFVEFPRKLIVDHCKCGLSNLIGQQEFSITSNVLSIVYAQTVAWIGAFYAPILPVIVVLKFFVFFYLKKLTLTYNCRPASRPYRASRSGTFFFVILLFGFAVAVFPVAISVSIITPSTDCGPFRNWPSMFYAVTYSILVNLPVWAQEMFWFFGSSPFAAALIVILGIAVYYFYVENLALKATVGLLRNLLKLEIKDEKGSKTNSKKRD